MNDPYNHHRAALAPLLPRCVSPETGVDPDDAFIDFVLQQGLGPLWDHAINERALSAPLSNRARERLHNSRLSVTGEYLIQRNSLNTIKSILDGAAIPHVVFKGCHTRERFFEEPALRPAQDIDVLVATEFKVDAIRAFVNAGFSFQGIPENISHECSLIKGKTNIDLHWDILRPGRTRVPMTKPLLDTRRDFGSHWGMDDNATLFILLVHPVFTKYLTTPHAALVRQMDLVYLLEKGEIDWSTAVGWLEQSGLKTTAWLSLTWLTLLTGISAPGETTLAQLEPGRLRRRYLNYWLSQNLPDRWLDTPLRTKLGFTLPAHDTWSDVLRATRVARNCRASGVDILHALRNTAQGDEHGVPASRTGS